MTLAEILTPEARASLPPHVQVSIWCAANEMSFAALCRELGVDQPLAWRVVRGRVRTATVAAAISERTGVKL